MKKKHLLMLLLFISCAIHAMAQTDYYYYYKGNKFPLILNENKVVVSIPKEYEETIERIRANVQVLKTIGDDYFDIIVIMRSDFEKLTSMDSWAEDSKYVLLDSCYFTENYFEGYATPYMTVKIKKEQDIDILTSYSERYRLRIVKQDSFMPLWYILSITLETGKTALEIANMLWESGDFASSEPDIAFDSSDPILSLSVNIDGLNYYLDPKSNVAIIIEGNNVSGELDIPSEVSYNEETFIVKSVFFSAFDNNQELTKVRIPKTMESVAHQLFNETDGGDFSDYMNPFMSCTALESVEVDEENPSFKSVDGVFFSKDGTELYCYPSGKQQKVYSIPEGVEWIGSRSFAPNYYLTTLTIPSTMKRICDEAIGACIKLTDVYCYAENVPNTGDDVFVSTPISSATLHVPANSIDKYKATYPWSEFGNIEALKTTVETTIDGLNYFLYLDGHEAILTGGNNCPGEVDIPSEVNYNEETFVVKSMVYSAFFYNSELTRVRIPKTIESVTHHVLNGMNGAVSPDHMNPFMGCTALESVEVDEENPSFKSVDGVFFSQDGKGQYYIGPDYFNGTGLYCYPAGKKQESYIIPEGVEWIGATAFEYSQHLTTLTIPSTMICIYGSAFKGCSNLTDVYCNAENVPKTNKQAFTDCPLASATLHVPAGSVEKYKTTSPWSEFGNIVALPEEPARPLPFLEGNPIWVFKDEQMPLGRVNDEACWIDAGLRAYTYYFLGEKKEIEGKVYTMMGEVRINGEWGINLIRWLPVREEDGVVYALTSYLPGVVDNFYNAYGNTIPYPQQENECVLYNFRDVLYPQDESSAGKSFDTYQLMDGTTCRVLSSGWSLPGAYVGIYDLYEKLGYVNIFSWYGVMDPLHGFTMTTSTHDVFMWSLNAYYQDDTMLYKAPDAQEGLCVNDTCWTREDAYAYAMTYKADPHHDEIMAYIRQLQTAEDPVTYTKDQIATIILPTEPDASKGKYYRLDRVEDGKIIFEQELQPQARVPYIIVPSEDFSIDPGALNLEGLHSDTVSIEGVSFIGSYVREELPALTGEDGVESSYIDFIDTTPDCGPSISAETGKESLLIGTLRAYLIVKWDDPIDHGSPSVPPFGKKEIVLHDYSTGINSLTPDPSPRRGEVFDLQGRRIDNSKLPRGIYIKDKKKVLIK